jgi:fasciclin domain-containing protein
MRTRIALVCTVWGPEFTNFFCQYSLASLLSPTNLPSAAAKYDFTLLLYTEENDLARMRAHENFRRVSELVDIKPVFLASLPSAARHGHWIQWHHALGSSGEFSSFILLIPDCLYTNDAIERIAASLEISDIVYYCIPQVCIEPIVPHLDEMSRKVIGDAPYSYLDFNQTDIASLFLKFINPRYAVALVKPDYFVSHPEYLLRPTKGRLELHELTCHPLAVSSRAMSVSYTFNSPAAATSTTFLDMLAVGVEYTLKYVEQYFRWPATGMQLSRYATLAHWSYIYFERGAAEYNKTQIEITAAGIEAVGQRRCVVENPRSKYARVLIEYHSTLYAIYDSPARACRRNVRSAIALAMSLSGFRKQLMSDGKPLTVLLPTSAAANRILDKLYDLGDPQNVLKFLLMHVIPGQLILRMQHSFVLERTVGRPPHRPRLRVIDPALVRSMPASITGQIKSQPTYVADGVITYSAAIQYGPIAEFIERLTTWT